MPAKKSIKISVNNEATQPAVINDNAPKPPAKPGSKPVEAANEPSVDQPVPEPVKVKAVDTPKMDTNPEPAAKTEAPKPQPAPPPPPEIKAQVEKMLAETKDEPKESPEPPPAVKEHPDFKPDGETPAANSVFSDGPQDKVPGLASGSRVLAIAVGIIVLLLGGGMVAFNLLAKPVNKPAPSNTATQSTSKSIPTENISDNFTIGYTPKAGAAWAPTKINLSLVAPAVLRTQISQRDCRNGSQGGKYNGSKLQDCIHFSFADTLGQGKSLNAQNSLELDEATEWLTANEAKGTQFPPFGLTSAADKQAKVNFLLNLSPSQDLTSKSAQNQILNLAQGVAFVGGMQKLAYIESSDQKLKGVAFITTPAQNDYYQPHTIFVLAGKIGSETVLIHGDFKLNDQLTQKYQSYVDALNNSTKAQLDPAATKITADFAAGNLAQDLQTTDGQVRDMIKSLKLSQN